MCLVKGCNKPVTRYFGTSECDRCYKYRITHNRRWSPKNNVPQICTFCNEPYAQHRIVILVDKPVVVKLCPKHNGRYKRNRFCTGVDRLCGNIPLKGNKRCYSCIKKHSRIEAYFRDFEISLMDKVIKVPQTVKGFFG